MKKLVSFILLFFINVAAWGGFNEDGFVDLVFLANSVEICLGAGNGGFSCSYNFEVTVNRAGDVEIGDINRDGHLDIALTRNSIGHVNKWCAGDGNGDLVCQNFPTNEGSNALSLGDIDGDFDLDVVFANSPHVTENSGHNRVCLGDGSGGFECSVVSEHTSGSSDVALADFNGDGLLDAVFANGTLPNRICLWRKVGGFECSDMADDSTNIRRVSTEDMNGDGAADIVFDNYGQPHQLCLGDYTGHFTCNNLGMEVDGDFALGDVNNDGHNDIVFARVNKSNRYCLGDGAGNFDCSDVSEEKNYTSGVALADVNDDGRIEVIFANQGPAANKICSWDGVSAFGCTVISGIIPGGALVATTFNVMGDSLAINSGFNDAWYDPETSGQGFFITVFPDLNAVSLAWFTYDTELPPVDAVAKLGNPGHRWLTAFGAIMGNQVSMNIEMTSGGLFDTVSEIIRTDPPGSDGTIILTFTSCNSGTVEYDIPSINRHGIVPIQRVANDNIVLCEALNSN